MKQVVRKMLRGRVVLGCGMTYYIYQ